jgi:hypothetical protein
VETESGECNSGWSGKAAAREKDIAKFFGSNN